MKGRRRLLGATIILAWAVVLAFHARREFFRPITVRLAEASANLIPAASFYSIKLGDAPIGYAASRIDTLTDGFFLDDDMRVRVQALGTEVPATARTRVRLGKKLDLQNFEFSLRSDIGDFRVDGTMDGDSALALVIDAGGEEEHLRLSTGGPVLLPQVMPIHFALGGGPKAGATYDFEVFDPSTLAPQRVGIHVVGRETLILPDSADYDSVAARWVPARFDTVDTWHVRQSFGGVELDSWVDLDGQIARAKSPLGYTIERTAFEIAWNEFRAIASSAEASARADGRDIIEGTAISVGVALPKGDRISGLSVRLRNVDLSGFDLGGGPQILSGDTLHVRVEAPPALVSYTLPADEGRWKDYLAATPLIQTNDPAIRNTAERVIGDSEDAAAAARRLTEWVYDELEKEITLSVPSARQVLKAGRGDCNEHTVLYVALARAIGLPARSAAGLVYVNDRFYYHAWPEVWLDRWVPVDPTLGQFPADASHLRFVIGGLARQVELVRLIGTLELDVITVEER